MRRVVSVTRRVGANKACFSSKALTEEEIKKGLQKVEAFRKHNAKSSKFAINRAHAVIWN
jgi:hypothetical protein